MISVVVLLLLTFFIGKRAFLFIGAYFLGYYNILWPFIDVFRFTFWAVFKVVPMYIFNWVAQIAGPAWQDFVADTYGEGPGNSHQLI